jgi:hypothetical protein
MVIITALMRLRFIYVILAPHHRYVYQYDPGNLDNYTANPYSFPVFPWLIVFEITYFGSTCLSVYFGIQCAACSPKRYIHVEI